MADDRTYIRVHDGLDEHPKVEPLSDAAFRLLLRCWFYCSRNRTDGRIADAIWKKRGTAKARRELLDAGLAEEGDGFVEMHDYLEHQRSAEEIRLLQETRGDSGTYGAHVRWHVVKRKPKKGCEHCFPGDGPGADADDKPIANGMANAIANGWQSHSKPMASTEAEAEAEVSSRTTSGGNATEVDARDPDEPPKCSRHRGLKREFVPDCLGCARKRQAWEASKTAEAEFGRTPWCGDDECDPITRKRSTPFGSILCPECHPLAGEWSA